MSNPLILRSDEDGVCTLTLNRPEKLNALTTESFDVLEQHVDALEGEVGVVGCVVIRGAGRSFCAGADLETASTAGPETAIRKSRILARLEALPMPVVAQVHGHCVGGGMELALCADVIAAAVNARFADAHGRWGLVPAWGLTQRLPRRIGVSAAKYLVFTGRSVSGVEAHRMHLVDVVAEEIALETTTTGLARDIVANSAFTNSEVKSLMRSTAHLSLVEGLAHEHFRFPRREPE